MNQNPFTSLSLGAPIQKALADCRYTLPTPIQSATIPLVLAGHDVMGCAQTGTGKTAAFALPILERLSRQRRDRVPHAPRVLVLAPTRELASQIQASFATYGRNLPFRSEVIFGGVGLRNQVVALRRGLEILVATPGRLLDLMGQGQVNLKHIEVFVIDEADRMLDMGFLPDVRRVIATLPARRQTLFFSATMPPPILELAARILDQPRHVEVTPQATTVEKIDQAICHVLGADKRRLLHHLLANHDDGLVLVFSATKHGANRLAEGLSKAGLPAEAIHGNKSQGARERALENFRSGRSRILVATDIAARGIDVKGIGLVVNYDLPKEPEAYVHRIGRTARAGAEGRAISLCDEQSHGLLRQIEKIIRLSIPVHDDHPFHREPSAASRPAGQPTHPQRGRSGGGGVAPSRSAPRSWSPRRSRRSWR